MPEMTFCCSVEPLHEAFDGPDGDFLIDGKEECRPKNAGNAGHTCADRKSPTLEIKMLQCI